jgi:hypothetical protein
MTSGSSVGCCNVGGTYWSRLPLVLSDRHQRSEVSGRQGDALPDPVVRDYPLFFLSPRKRIEVRKSFLHPLPQLKT